MGEQSFIRKYRKSKTPAKLVSISRDILAKGMPWLHRKTAYRGKDGKYMQSLELTCRDEMFRKALSLVRYDEHIEVTIDWNVIKGCSFPCFFVFSISGIEYTQTFNCTVTNESLVGELVCDEEISAYIGESKKATKLRVNNPSEFKFENVLVKLDKLSLCSSQEGGLIVDNDKTVRFSMSPNSSRDISVFYTPTETPSKCKETVKICFDNRVKQFDNVILQTKSKEKPSPEDIQFEFVQNEQNIYTGYNYKTPITVGVITVAYETTALERYDELHLSDLVHGGSSQVVVNSFGVESIAPGAKAKAHLIVQLQGVLDLNEIHCWVSYKSNRYEYVIRLKERAYKEPIQKFFPEPPRNTQLEYEYPALDPHLPIKIGVISCEYDSKDGKTLERENARLTLSEGFYFEENLKTVPYVEGENHSLYFDVYNKIGTTNIDKNEKFDLCFSFESDEPNIRIDKNLTITIKPFKCKAQLQVSFAEDGKDAYILSQSQGKELYIQYNEDQLRDKSIVIGHLIIGNSSKIPYFGEGIEIKGLKILPLNGSCDVVECNEVSHILKNGDEPLRIKTLMDVRKWKESGCEKQIQFGVELTYRYINDNNENDNNWQTASYHFSMKLSEVYVDNVFSLDLGTTGIVVAGIANTQISLLPLPDNSETASRNIEPDEHIISSITIMKEADRDSEGSREIELSPRRLDYNSGENFVFVPAKFIVGQTEIPFVRDECPSDVSIHFKSQPEQEYCLDEANKNNYLSPDRYISAIYQDILSRIRESGRANGREIKKLCLTYPNTYTEDSLSKLREIIQTNFGFNGDKLVFVPESDAVVAHYFNTRVTSSECPIQEGKEHVLIYDMGAGTLDVSYVLIEGHGNSVEISIEKRIGIPIAGNYLDWYIYHALKENGYFKDNLNPEKERQIKKLITSFIKPNFQKNEPLRLNTQIHNDEDYTALFNEVRFEKNEDGIECLTIDCNDIDLSDYLKICCDTAIESAVVDFQDLDAIVFSGRASQFIPVRKRIKDIVNNRASGRIVRFESFSDDGNLQSASFSRDENDSTGGGVSLKTCVAKGALRYMDMFNSGQRYSINNKNQYLKMGVVYCMPVTEGSTIKHLYKYTEIFNPETCDWSRAQMLSGTRCLAIDKNIEIDISLDNHNVYFIQTSLPEHDIEDLYNDRMRGARNGDVDLRWAFINELFCINSSKISHRSKPVRVSVSIDAQNQMSRTIGNREMSDTRVTEIISNVFYRRSMWPFCKNI